MAENVEAAQDVQHCRYAAASTNNRKMDAYASWRSPAQEAFPWWIPPPSGEGGHTTNSWRRLGKHGRTERARLKNNAVCRVADEQTRCYSINISYGNFLPLSADSVRAEDRVTAKTTRSCVDPKMRLGRLIWDRYTSHFMTSPIVMTSLVKTSFRMFLLHLCGKTEEHVITSPIVMTSFANKSFCIFILHLRSKTASWKIPIAATYSPRCQLVQSDIFFKPNFLRTVFYAA